LITITFIHLENLYSALKGIPSPTTVIWIKFEQLVEERPVCYYSVAFESLIGVNFR